MGKLHKALCYLLLYFASANSEMVSPRPQVLESFNLSLIQQKNVGSCSYRVIITTSCSSPKYTGDQISLSFGDAYGNQIYVPRLDDPSTGTFERCSSDTFQISGPCAYQICYAYVYRTGPDGWKPESVRIYGYHSRTVTFDLNTYIPSNVWYGVNLCGSTSSARPRPIPAWAVFLVLGILAGVLL
uniref:Embryo-specific protein ATS3B n=1 Tax=Rhizophora mucronata TaxID=61149 RepID=A0A2P2IQX2_RHIMU